MNSLDVKISGGITASGKKTTGIVESTNPLISSPIFSLTFGSGADNANSSYSENVASAAGSKTWDLDAGVIKDAFGDAIVFTKIKGLLIRNKSTTVSIVVTSTTIPMASLTIGPGGFLVIGRPDATGFAVTAGTGDLIQVTWTGTCNFDIVLVGTV